MTNILLSISRVAFTIGSLEVYWYGITMTLGMLAGFAIALLWGKKRGYSDDFVFELFIVTVIFAVVGARIVYVLANSQYYFPINDWQDFWNLFNLRGGGITIIGGIGFGIIGVLIVCRHQKVSLIQTLDLIVPCILIGQVIGRWGNFVNQEAYGMEVTNPAWQWFPFAVFIDDTGAWHQATFFYESILNLFAFGMIWLVVAKRWNKPGALTFGYFAWYGLVRAIMEITRLDAVVKDWGFLGQVKITQLLCSVMAVVGAVVVTLIQVGVIKFCPVVNLKDLKKDEQGKEPTAENEPTQAENTEETKEQTEQSETEETVEPTETKTEKTTGRENAEGEKND